MGIKFDCSTDMPTEIFVTIKIGYWYYFPHPGII